MTLGAEPKKIAALGVLLVVAGAGNRALFESAGATQIVRGNAIQTALLVVR